MPKSLYDRLASTVREMYYRRYNEINGTRYGTTEYPLYDGGVDIYGRKHKPVWPTIVKFLVDQNIDVIDYLEDTLGRYAMNKPRDLIRPSYVEDYIERKNSPIVKRRWDAEESAINTRIKFRVALGDTLERAAETVLLDISSEISPLVRYVFARKAFPSIDMGESTELAAMKQYNERWKAYNKYCGDRIPEEWRKEE